ncbi:serine/threonine-protein kinase [Thermomonospora amylolytica]|uniref:serine/threonine-protein kinase n=1 Tax=Thermomonospora amylolytica TaxID=1411117 RepID=UPI0018E51AC6|nr:serine/threonine-protein kinase [Thermomonospora amylolytica]
MRPLLPDDPVAYGPHVLLARLGAGGTGVVYLARSPGGRLVAVKAVHSELAADPAFRERFARELAALRAAGGAFTASLVDADPDASRPWLATVYLPGATLEEVVRATGPLPVPAVNALGAGLAEALVSIHRAGVAHRDVKPSNVMITPYGPRLIDLGMARPPGTAELPETMPGTPGYLPPEQASGGEGGPAGDVFSLAAALVFAATGAGPFDADTVPAVLYRVLHAAPSLDGVTDAPLRAFLGSCLSRDPRERPTAAQVMEFFAGRAGAGLPFAAAAVVHQAAGRVPPPGAPPWRMAPSVKRRRMVKGLVIGGAVALAGGTAGAAGLLVSRAPDSPEEWRRRLPENASEVFPAGAMVLAMGYDLGCYALDGRTGKRRWHRSDLSVSPNLGGLLLAGDVPVGYDSRAVYALNPSTGEELWRHSAESRWHPPACDRNIVCIPTSEGVGEGLLIGRDARTGAERWRRAVGTHVRDTGVALGGGVAYFSAEGGALEAVEAATGRSRWRVVLGRGTLYRMDTPVVAGGAVYVFDNAGVLHARGAGDGARRWTAEVGGVPGDLETEQVMVVGDAVHTMTTDGTIRSFDAATGRARWRLPTGVRARRRLAGQMTPAGDVLLVMAHETLLGVGAADGRVRWRQEIGIQESAPVLAGGLAHLRTLHGIRSYDPADGRPVRLLAGSQYSTPSTLRAHRDLVLCSVYPADVVALRPR